MACEKAVEMQVSKKSFLKQTGNLINMVDKNSTCIDLYRRNKVSSRLNSFPKLNKNTNVF